MRNIKYFIIHCTATREGSDYTPEQLEADHRARGFKKVGYHFYVRRDGSKTQHRLLAENGAHCKGYNRSSIGIAYEGGLDATGRPANTLTTAQRDTIQDIITCLHAMFPTAVIRGHRDMPGVNKDCPCLNAADTFHL